MSLATNRIHVSRDVVFHENIFPFTLSAEKCTFSSTLKSVEFVSPSPNIAGYANFGSNDNYDNDPEYVVDSTTNLSHLLNNNFLSQYHHYLNIHQNSCKIIFHLPNLKQHSEIT